MTDGICRKCKKYTEHLIDEELCVTCHDIWLEGLLNNTDVMKMVRLNQFKEDIDLGELDD